MRGGLSAGQEDCLRLIPNNAAADTFGMIELLAPVLVCVACLLFIGGIALVLNATRRFWKRRSAISAREDRRYERVVTLVR